eukprot:Nitzschia sp. Nitz4//scaffold462_size6021//679//1620//NITZ4_009193-RA/size6021-processed-gene-0.1-mRNA-1//1//CDS//3329552494//2700//frame0
MAQDSTTSISATFPLIELPQGEEADLESVGKSLVEALQTSGFLLIRSPEVDLEMQNVAIKAAANVLLGDHKSEFVIEHPTDPKLYMMLESMGEINEKCSSANELSTNSANSTPAQILTKYWIALENVKRAVLRCIALGLGLEREFFVDLHSENMSVLRLLHYPEVTSSTAEPIVRCKAHSDYGSITLLLTRVPGLQALVNDEWINVPPIEGALSVNIGSLLQDWTDGSLLATLHRVVDINPAPRTSLAFFADPNPDVSATLKKDSSEATTSSGKYKSVAEYIQWRSGGTGKERSGLAFSEEEAERVKGVEASN